MWGVKDGYLKLIMFIWMRFLVSIIQNMVSFVLIQKVSGEVLQILPEKITISLTIIHCAVKKDLKRANSS